MLQQPPPESIDDPYQLVPIIRYVGILANKYPKPLSNKELAGYARVSEPAVSKLKDRLFSLCDDRWLGHRRRLLLRTDNETASQIFAGFFFSGRLTLLLKSPYGKAVIHKWAADFYRKAAKAAPDIRTFLDEEDVVFVAEFFSSSVAESMKHLDFRSVFDSSERLGVQYAFIGLVYEVWTRMGPSLRGSLRDEVTLLRLLTIRDKAWFLLQEGIRRRMETILGDFLRGLPDDQTRRNYLSVYRQTTDFYLERAISKFITEPLRECAAKRGIRFNRDFTNLGHFYVPSVSSAGIAREKSSSMNNGGRESRT